MDSVVVGPFKITVPSPHGENKIMIYHDSGEGGEFSLPDFIKAVSEFYDKNF